MIYARRLSCAMVDVKPEIPDLLISVKKNSFICRADLSVACFGSMHQLSLFTYGFRRMFIYWFFHNCSFSFAAWFPSEGRGFMPFFQMQRLMLMPRLHLSYSALVNYLFVDSTHMRNGRGQREGIGMETIFSKHSQFWTLMGAQINKRTGIRKML